MSDPVYLDYKPTTEEAVETMLPFREAALDTAGGDVANSRAAR